jgi:hypothetical protein
VCGWVRPIGVGDQAEGVAARAPRASPEHRGPERDAREAPGGEAIQRTGLTMHMRCGRCGRRIRQNQLEAVIDVVGAVPLDHEAAVPAAHDPEDGVGHLERARRRSREREGCRPHAARGRDELHEGRGRIGQWLPVPGGNRQPNRVGTRAQRRHLEPHACLVDGALMTEPRRDVRRGGGRRGRDAEDCREEQRGHSEGGSVRSVRPKRATVGGSARWCAIGPSHPRSTGFVRRTRHRCRGSTTRARRERLATGHTQPRSPIGPAVEARRLEA